MQCSIFSASLRCSFGEIVGIGFVWEFCEAEAMKCKEANSVVHISENLATKDHFKEYSVQFNL